jgi:hypothetical protein
MADKRLTPDMLDRAGVAQLQRQLRASSLVWTLMVAVLMLGLVVLKGAAATAALGFVLVLWIWANWNTARHGAHLRHVGLAAGGGDYEAMAAPLLMALNTFTLSRGSRLVAYQHLAALRAAQGRFDQASALCWALLQHQRRRSGLRGRLWLLEAECRLRLRDLPAVHQALTQAHNLPLRAAEALQLVGLQILYEAQTGQTEQLTQGLAAKVALVRMMPAPQAGEILTHLALAAEAQEAPAIAVDLRRHALLLGGGEPALETPAAEEQA